MTKAHRRCRRLTFHHPQLAHAAAPPAVAETARAADG
jgi:hypothetical protein